MLIDGELAIAVSVPPLTLFCVVENVFVPAVVPAVAPSLAVQDPPDVAPYVTVNVEPPDRVSALTLIVWPENDNVPVLTVVHPIASDAVGAVHPVGTAMSTSPLARPPVAAVYVNTTV